jgi:hypothetical protein
LFSSDTYNIVKIPAISSPFDEKSYFSSSTRSRNVFYLNPIIPHVVECLVGPSVGIHTDAAPGAPIVVIAFSSLGKCATMFTEGV